jgi:cytochrome c553
MNQETLRKRNELRRKHKQMANNVPKYIDGVCKECEFMTPLRFNSTFSQTGKPEYRTKCDACHSKRERELRKANRPRLNERNKASNRKKKIELIGLKGGKCERCGIEYNGKNAVIFQFHHRDPSQKDFEISSNLRVRSYKRVKEELEKCAMLCANCHELEHHEEY